VSLVDGDSVVLLGLSSSDESERKKGREKVSSQSRRREIEEEFDSLPVSLLLSKIETGGIGNEDDGKEESSEGEPGRATQRKSVSRIDEKQMRGERTNQVTTRNLVWVPM